MSPEQIETARAELDHALQLRPHRSLDLASWAARWGERLLDTFPAPAPEGEPYPGAAVVFVDHHVTATPVLAPGEPVPGSTGTYSVACACGWTWDGPPLTEPHVRSEAMRHGCATITFAPALDPERPFTQE